MQRKKASKNRKVEVSRNKTIEKMNSRSKSSFNRMAVLGFIALISLVLMVYLFYTSEEAEGEEVLEIGMVVDLGSSGTRMHLLGWWKGKESDVMPLSVVAPWLMEGVGSVSTWKSKPGISTYLSEPQKGVDALVSQWTSGPSLVWQKIGVSDSAPVLLLATAGLRVAAEAAHERLLDDDDSDLNYMLDADDDEYMTGPVSNLLHSLPEFYARAGLHLQQREQIRVLSGSEEGLFDLLSLLQVKKSGKVPWLQGELGCIDLGGASTQISFFPMDERDASVLHSFALGNRIYTHSFLDYGINRAFDHFMSLKQSKEGCFLKGYQYQPGQVGTGDWSQCIEAVDSLFHSVVSPTFNSVNIPSAKPDVRFVAYDHAFRVANFFGLPEDFSAPSLLKEAVEQLFSKDWSYTMVHHSELEQNALAKIGFEGVYLYRLLTLGYGLHPEKPVVAYAEELGSVDMSWALGAMVHYLSPF